MLYEARDDGFFCHFRPVIYSTDAVIFTLPPEEVAGGEVSALIYRRTDGDQPFADCWALPGGFVHTDEDANDRAACERVIRNKLGFDAPFLEQLQTFSGAARDPRGWSATVVYFALVPWGQLAPWWTHGGGGKRGDVDLLPVGKIHGQTVSLAFDHVEILRTAIARLDAKSRYSSLPCMLLPEHFTIKQMHDVYQAIRDEQINIAAFRRKVMALDFIEEVRGQFERGPQRPAQLYRLRAGTALFDRTL